MSKTIKNPILFSDYFGLERSTLATLKVFDPILNVDTKLFIDPMLLCESNHLEMQQADQTINDFFELIIKLLLQSKAENDLPWTTAYKKFLFKEISGTCIGYGSGIHGSGWGPVKARKTTNTAKQIIDIGVKDSDLFMAIPLLEENIGPDLISDMVTNIVIENILDFNERIVSELKISTKEFKIRGRVILLPENPTETNESPIILLPMDILRELPLANDWAEVCSVAAENDVLRGQVNKLIGEIWKVKSKQNKSALREKALASADAFMSILETLRHASPQSYDFENDPDGHFTWMAVKDAVSKEYPLALKIESENAESMMGFVSRVIDQFKWLIEERGLSNLLWKKSNEIRVHEEVAQRLFFAVADSYAKANNIDITPEADIGRGAVDFKFSSGYDAKVLVEIKFSDHGYVVAGYESQLEIYKSAEKTTKGFYLILDVGHMGTKAEQILEIKNKFIKANGVASELVIIDSAVKLSASKVH